MKYLLFSLLAQLVFTVQLVANTSKFEGHNPAFKIIPNRGQIQDQNGNPRPDVLFAGQAEHMFFHATRHVFSYQLLSSNTDEHDSNQADANQSLPSTSISRLDYEWVGVNAGMELEYHLPVYETINYYNVPAKKEGVKHVPVYKSVVFKNLWKDIDWVIYENNGDIEHEFILKRAEDFSKIAFKVHGATTSMDKNTSEIILNTPNGTIKEGRLIVIQNGKKLPARWQIDQDNTVRMQIEGFTSGKPLTIDPHVKAWGTYFGGPQDDNSGSIIRDGAGNIYTCGNTISLTNIATAGAFQTSYSDNGDVFLAKFNANGLLTWATYFGGNQNDQAFRCKLDPSGNILMVGTTRSAGIATAGAYLDTLPKLPSLGIPFNAAFVAKFTSNGERTWVTYYGGQGADYAYDIAIEPNGTFYIAGNTTSESGIATQNSFKTIKSGQGDAFISKFSANGMLLWGTYYGGSHAESVSCVKILNDGNLIISGATNSGDLPTNSASFQANYASTGGVWPGEAYIAKFDTSGKNLIWNTYYGGSLNDIIQDMVEDATGNLYFLGQTSSLEGIATPGAFQTERRAGDLAELKSDAFLLKMNANGQRIWATYYGGTFDEISASIGFDLDGNINVVGSSRSADLTMTGCLQCTSGGLYDAFLALFNPDGQLVKSTYLGGTGNDFGRTIAFDADQAMLIHGVTTSNTGIATPGTHQSTRSGMQDVFILKLTNPDIAIAVQEKIKFDLKLHPNPASEVAFIKDILPGAIIMVTDALGRVLIHKQHLQATTAFIPLGNLSNGIYNVLVDDGKNKRQGRLVVKH